MPGVSANARKQQEEDIERLVKCRLRSEIEARKAVESTMKRAVQEARELKKELVLLRQEKEELRATIQKNAVSGPGSGGKEASRYSQSGRTASGGTGKDHSTSKQGSNKATELKLKQQIQTLTSRKTELETSTQELQQQVAELESEKAAAISQLTTYVAEKEREIATLQHELRKTKLAIDETKRKCQKMLKEKREETQRAIQENEQLARCAKTLQGQLALLPQLKQQLEHAKEKRADVAEVWQKKLEERNQAILREEEASKRKLAESAEQIDKLSKEKLELEARLEELELKFRDSDNNHEAELRHEVQRIDELEGAMKQLQEELQAAQVAAQEAERAETVARDTQRQETRLRQLAEDAADAVEVRAEKAQRDLTQAIAQLSRLEDTLKARGVTLDYLLKQQTPISVAGRAPGTDKNKCKTKSTTTTLRKTCISRDPARGKTIVKTRQSVGSVDPKAHGRTRLKGNNNEEE